VTNAINASSISDSLAREGKRERERGGIKGRIEKKEKDREKNRASDLARLSRGCVPPAGRSFIKPAIIRANSLVNADK